MRIHSFQSICNAYVCFHLHKLCLNVDQHRLRCINRHICCHWSIDSSHAYGDVFFSYGSYQPFYKSSDVSDHDSHCCKCKLVAYVGIFPGLTARSLSRRYAILWPLFVFLLILFWIFALLFLVSALATSDFCVDPDKNMQSILVQ